MGRKPEAMEPVPALLRGWSQEGEDRGWREVRQGPGQYWLDNHGYLETLSKPDSHPPSFKPDVSGASGDQPPRIKSTVGKGSQKGRSSHTPSNTQLGDLKKKEIRDKPHWWIESWVKRLDPAGYMEEIHSMRYFRRNATCLHYRSWL